MSRGPPATPSSGYWSIPGLEKISGELLIPDKSGVWSFGMASTLINLWRSGELESISGTMKSPVETSEGCLTPKNMPYSRPTFPKSPPFSELLVFIYVPRKEFSFSCYVSLTLVSIGMNWCLSCSSLALFTGVYWLCWGSGGKQSLISLHPSSSCRKLSRKDSDSFDFYLYISLLREPTAARIYSIIFI